MCTNYLDNCRRSMYVENFQTAKKKIHIFSKSFPRQFTALSTG